MQCAALSSKVATTLAQKPVVATRSGRKAVAVRAVAAQVTETKLNTKRSEEVGCEAERCLRGPIEDVGMCVQSAGAPQAGPLLQVLPAAHRCRRRCTPCAQQIFQEAQELLPGGVNSPVRAFKSVGGQPIVFDRVKVRPRPETTTAADLAPCGRLAGAGAGEKLGFPQTGAP